MSIRALAVSESGLLIKEDAGGLRRAPPDPAPKLVKLRQAEQFGVLDDHDGGVRHVNADLDDGRGHQDRRFPRRKRRNGRILFRAGQAPMDEADALAEDLAQMGRALLRRRHLARRLAFDAGQTQ